MSSAKAEVANKTKEYVMRYYGNLISADEPTFDENEKLWKAQLKSNYPRLIKNDFPQEERFIRVLPLKGLGTICLNEELQFVKDCSIKREESISLIHSYLEMWRQQVENIIVEASSLQLARTSPARVFLNPANMILANLRQRKDVTLSFEQLEKLRRHARIERWLALLKDLKLIKRIEDGYTYGDMFTTLEKEARSDNEFEILSMAYILKNSYPLLKEIFHIQQFEPLVHLDSCYYRPALEAPEITLYQTSDSLFRRFIVDYRFKPVVELNHILYELHKSEALLSDRQYYYKNDVLFKNMLDLKSQIPEMIPPQA
jgi:hypothetical protein